VQTFPFGSMMVRFLTLNVNGLRDHSKQQRLLNWFSSFTPSLDIICLQETHLLSDAELSSWFANVSYSVFGCHHKNHSSGVCILYKPTFSITDLSITPSGRFVKADFHSSFHDFTVCSLYAPNHYFEREPFFEEISSLIDGLLPTFLLGDFNSVFDRDMYRLSPQMNFTIRDGSTLLRNFFRGTSLEKQILVLKGQIDSGSLLLFPAIKVV
jgi:exonuclease III